MTPDRQPIRSLHVEEAPACEAILRALPEWFGIEQSLMDYVRDLMLYDTLVARGPTAVDGFLTWRLHSPTAAEIHCMAVRRACHGQGLGRSLIRETERLCRARGIAYLQVKTLGPSRPNKHYAGTRAFYERLGFTPLEEHDLWGERNPCLVMLKHLACTPGSR